MMLPWIAYALLSAAAFAALGGLFERSLSGRRIARRFTWLATIVSSVALPVAGSWLASPRITTITGAAAASAPVSNVAAATPIDFDRLAVIGWVSLSALVVVLLATSQIGLRRRLRRCEGTLIDDQSAFVSDDFGPAVVGVVRPVIVLPKWALALGDVDRRLVIAHEREHIAARDPLLNALGLG